VNLLLDTHTLIWWAGNDGRLKAKARAAIAEPGNRVCVSAASAWECAVKVQNGKLPQAAPLLAAFRPTLERSGFQMLQITLEHAIAAGALPRHHGDPWDRMLIAQALAEGMVLVSKDKEFDPYGVSRVW
jgi:PIN domain nuclease of toxin-antitoxin system